MRTQRFGYNHSTQPIGIGWFDYSSLSAVAEFPCIIAKQVAKIAENIKQQAVETEEEEDEDDDSVFAKLKSNKVNKLEKQLKITRDDIVCEQANKYMKRGLVKESVFYTNKDKKETKNSNLSFSDWIKGN